jgi:hypothetical protein
MNAQGISPAKITFKRPPPVLIKPDGAKIAGIKTHFTAHTFVVINDGPHHRVINSADGLFGACRNAGSVFAVLADQGQIPAAFIHLNHANAGFFRVADPGFPDGTGSLTHPATVAFIWI